MATFFMFGKYGSEAALKEASADRTRQAVGAIRKLGGEVQSMYALLGEHDLTLIVELPGAEEAMKASLTLSKLTGISFSTAAAVPVENFDNLLKEI